MLNIAVDPDGSLKTKGEKNPPPLDPDELLKTHGLSGNTGRPWNVIEAKGDMRQVRSEKAAPQQLTASQNREIPSVGTGSLSRKLHA